MQKSIGSFFYNLFGTAQQIIFRLVITGYYSFKNGIESLASFNFTIVLTTSLVVLLKFGGDIFFNLKSKKYGFINIIEFIPFYVILTFVTLILFLNKEWIDENILLGINIEIFIFLFLVQYTYQLLVPCLQGLEKFKVNVVIGFISILLSIIVFITNEYSKLLYTWYSIYLFHIIFSILYLLYNKNIIIKKVKFNELGFIESVKSFSIFQITNTLILKADTYFVKIFFPNSLGLYTTILNVTEAFYLIPRAYMSLQLNKSIEKTGSVIRNDKIHLIVLWGIFSLISYFLTNLIYANLANDHIPLYLLSLTAVLVYSLNIVLSHEKLYNNKKRITKIFILGLLLEIVVLFIFKEIYDNKLENLIFLVIITYLFIFVSLIKPIDNNRE